MIFWIVFDPFKFYVTVLLEKPVFPCDREGGIYGGGEGDAQVAEGASSEVGSYGRGVGFKELVHPVQRGVCWLAVDWRDVRVFEALNELVYGGGRHGGGLTN